MDDKLQLICRPAMKRTLTSVLIRSDSLSYGGHSVSNFRLENGQGDHAWIGIRDLKICCHVEASLPATCLAWVQHRYSCNLRMYYSLWGQGYSLIWILARQCHDVGIHYYVLDSQL